MDHRRTRPIRAVLTLLATATWAVAIAASTPGLALVPSRTAPAVSASPTPTEVPPGAVRVRIVLLRGGERLPGDDSIAWLRDLRSTGPSQTTVRIAQRDKQFTPRVSVVSVGSTVDFPNFDRVFHNVFSLSSPGPFDLGLYRKGKSKSVRFDQPGLVQVYCNIHPHMAAYLMVVDSDRYETADGEGLVTLRRVPAGRRTVEGWNVRGGMWSRQVSVRPARTTDITVELDISSWREVQHLNKHGKEYPPPDDDDFRY